MNRSDICPSCGKQLRWSPPNCDTLYGQSGFYYCSRCKYKRYEGSDPNQFSLRKRKGKRG